MKNNLMSEQWIAATWDAPPHVCAGTTTRLGGYSSGVYDSFNLGHHVSDQSSAVLANRTHLRRQFKLADEPIWLNQEHGDHVLSIGSDTYTAPPAADAAICSTPNKVCAVLTADCLPIVICDQHGTQIAVIHAGWRGMAKGVVQATIKKFTRKADTLLAWLGPAIGPEHYEVGTDVFHEICRQSDSVRQGFRSTSGGKYLCNLYGLATILLKECGVQRVWGGEWCTYRDSYLFYSHRRDGVTGRMATLIWIKGE